MNNRQLENLIRRKLENRNFEFREAYWKEMETLIDLNEQGSAVPLKLNLLYWTLSLLVLPGLLSAFMLITTPSEKQVQATSTPVSSHQETALASARPLQQAVSDDKNSLSNASGKKIERNSVLSKTTDRYISGLEEKASISPSKRKRSMASGNLTVNESNETRAYLSGGIAKKTEIAEEKKRNSFRGNSSMRRDADAAFNEAISFNYTFAPLLSGELESGSLPEDCRLLPGICEETAKKSKVHGHFSIIAGVRGYEGLRNSGTQKASPSISPVAGLKYSLGFNSRFSLHSAIQYGMRNGLNSFREYQKESYSFGFTKELIRISYKELHYLELPLYAKYRLIKLHHLTAGLSLTYIPGVRTETYITRENALGDRQSGTNKDWQKTPALSEADLALIAGYEHFLGRKLNLACRFHYGLSDLSSNAYFNNKTYDRNMHASILLEYALGR